MSQETCDSCPWDCEYGRAGESRKYLTVDEEGNTLECPARKAFRVCRDEVRRLRARSPLAVFYENAFRLCGVTKPNNPTEGE